MSQERRGPEYVHAHVVKQRRSRVRRNFSLAVFPLLGVGLAIVFASVILPHRRSEDQYGRLLEALRRGSTSHTIEFRPTRDREIILREDWILGTRRRLEYFGGQFVAYHFSQDGKSEDYIYEQAPNVLRKHTGATLVAPALERLLTDIREREVVSTKSHADGTLEIETRRKKLRITMDPNSGRPTQWYTFLPTDRGDETLLRTEVHYDVDPGKLKYDEAIWAATPVDMHQVPDPHQRQTTARARVGNDPSDLELVTVDVNQTGDVFYVYRAAVERPFIEVRDSQGNRYSPTDVYLSSRAGDRFIGEQVALRLDQAHMQWPVSVTFRVHQVDAKGLPKQSTGKELTLTFDRPTCFMAPTHWFQVYLGDAPLYDYQRTRHFRLAQVFQSAVRTPSGQFIDALGGGVSTLEQPEEQRRDPADLQRAISEARQLLRVRSEYEAGRISHSRIYVLLADLYAAAGQKDEARRVVQFVQGMLRDGRADTFVAAEIERAAKELGL